MRFKLTKSMKISINDEQKSFMSSKDKIEAICNKENIVAFDIFDENNLIGFAMLRKFAKDKWFLWDYAIDKKYQNKGYGKRALSELIDYMKINYGLKKITTTYITENDIAKRLYQNLGFEITEVIDEENCHEVNMELNI